jgi:hypothetical protein
MRAAGQWPQIYAGNPWMNFVYQFDDWRIDRPSCHPRRTHLRPHRLGGARSLTAMKISGGRSVAAAAPTTRQHFTGDLHC